MAISFRWTVKKTLRFMARSLKRRRFVAPARASPRIAYWIAGGMGDGIMALPALMFLKKHFPHAAIDVYVPVPVAAQLSSLLDPFPVYAYTVKNILAKTTYGLGYNYSFTNTIAAFRLSIEFITRGVSRYAAGFRYPDENPNNRLYDFTLAISETAHDIDQNLLLVAETIGVPIEESDRSYREKICQPKKYGPVNILIHPGTGQGYGYKGWRIEKYRELIVKLLGQKRKVTILLGPSDLQHYPFWAKIHGTILQHSHDVSSLINAVQEADLFIGNDSGPAHCASLFGTPTITLFGPTNPRRCAPFGTNSIVIANTTACAPCHFKKVTCTDYHCMSSITVEQVLDAVDKIIKIIIK
jgi:ADP-heptose:LPS heptosyltransferase